MINLDKSFNLEDQKTFRSYFNIVDSNVISLDEATDICIMEVHDHMHCQMKTGWLIDRLYKEKSVVCVEENAMQIIDQSHGQTAYVKRRIRVLGWDDKDEAKEKESKDTLRSDFVKRQQSMVKTLQSNRNAPQRFTIAGAAHFALADKQFTQKIKQAAKVTDADANAFIAEFNRAAKPGIDIIHNDLRTRKYVILEGYTRPLTGVAKQKIEKEYAYCKWPTWLDGSPQP